MSERGVVAFTGTVLQLAIIKLKDCISAAM